MEKLFNLFCPEYYALKTTVLLKFNLENTRRRACLGTGVVLANGLSMALYCRALCRADAAEFHRTSSSERCSGWFPDQQTPDVMTALLSRCCPPLCAVAQGSTGCGVPGGVAAAGQGGRQTLSPLPSPTFPGGSWLQISPFAPLLILQEQPGLSLVLPPCAETTKLDFAA